MQLIINFLTKRTMNIVNGIALFIGAVIVIATVGVALYKWIFNTRADLSPRDKKKEDKK